MSVFIASGCPDATAAGDTSPRSDLPSSTGRSRRPRSPCLRRAALRGQVTATHTLCDIDARPRLPRSIPCSDAHDAEQPGFGVGLPQATSAPTGDRLCPMPPLARCASGDAAILDLPTRALHERGLRRANRPRPAACAEGGAPATEDLDLFGAALTTVAASPAALAVRSWQMRARPMRTCAGTATAVRGSRRRSEIVD